MARAIPVFPLVGSRMILSDVRSPLASATSIIFLAIRSFTEPVGLLPSSLAQSRMPALGLILGRPTRGVFPTASRMSLERTWELCQAGQRVIFDRPGYSNTQQ